MRHSAGDTADETAESALAALPVLLHVIAGFLAGGVIGYLAAFVLPRRDRAALVYEAPIPPGHEDTSSPILDLLAQRAAQGAG